MDAPAKLTCPECRGIGWLLNEHHVGQNRPPITLDLLPCIYPGCTANAPAIATLGIRGQFNDVVRHPTDGSVLALTGFTAPAWR